MLQRSFTLLLAVLGSLTVTPAEGKEGEADWPSNRESLLFVWETGKQKHSVADPQTGEERPYAIKKRGQAGLDVNHSMALTRGSFTVEGADQSLLDACRKTNQITVEAVVLTHSLTQGGPARIVTFSRDASNRNFTLGQQNDKLILRLRTPKTGTNGSKPQTELCSVESGKRTHVIATYRDGALTCYQDGQQVMTSSKVTGDFSNWSPCHLLFGDEWTGGRDWSGSLEGIAIYSRALSPEEAAMNAAAYRPRLKNRKPVQLAASASAPAAREEPVSTPSPTIETVKPNAEARKLLGDDFRGARALALRNNAIILIDLGEGKVTTLASFQKTARFRGLTRPYLSLDGREIVYAYGGQAHRMNADGSNHRKALEGERAFEAKFWDDPKTGERCLVSMTANGKHWYPRNKGIGQTWLHRPDGKKAKLADFPCGGGLSLDGTHLGDAYGGCLMKDLTTGKFHILYGGKQACNATMSPDNTYRLMHLYLPHKYFGIRNKFDKELWRIDNPKGSAEWQNPRWSNHPEFCMATAKFGTEYKMVMVKIETKEMVILHEYPGSWSVPYLWLPSAPSVTRGKVAGAAGPIDHLKLTRLSSYKAKLAQAGCYTPIIAELKTMDDGEAKRVIAELETAGAMKLAKARSSPDALESHALLKELAAKFHEHPIGKQATDFLASPQFKLELEAATALGELAELSERLYPVKGAQRKFTDKAFLARNRAVLAQMIHLVAEMQLSYPKTKATARAAVLRKEYSLPDTSTLAGNERLTVLATIDAPSKVPTAQQIAPYKDAITYIVYKVEKVLDGKYDGKSIVVVHWGMKNTKHTAAASWKPGLKQRLVLDLFDAHKELHEVTAAQDADEPELVPYWVLEVESIR